MIAGFAQFGFPFDPITFGLLGFICLKTVDSGSTFHTYRREFLRPCIGRWFVHRRNNVHW